MLEIDKNINETNSKPKTNCRQDFKDQIVKFTKIDYVDSIIEGKLWASFAEEFNDPYDARLVLKPDFNLLDLAENPVSSIKKYGITQNDPVYRDIVNAYKLCDEVILKQENYKNTSSIVNNFKDISAVLTSHQMICLSKCNPAGYESLPMWAYYADSGKGICITYKLSSFESFPLNGTLKEIKYECPPENHNIEIFSDELILNSLSRNQTEVGNEIDMFLSKKHIIWQHEQEYRILVSLYKQRIKEVLGCKPDYDIYKTKFDKDSIYKVEELDRFVKMPFPFSIILGWKFDYTKNNDNLEKLKKYCYKEKVKLFKLSSATSGLILEEI